MYIVLVFVLYFLYLQVFEHSVASMGPEGRNEAGRFLQVLSLSKSNPAKKNNKRQVGGFKLKFDLRRPRLDRLVLAEVGSCKLYTCTHM